MSMNLEGFEVRPEFIRKLLNNPRSATPLTGTEVEISKHLDILMTIQEELDTNLSLFLQRNSPYVSVRDQIFFLLDTYEQDDLDLAIQTLEAAYEDRVSLTATELFHIIKENSETYILPSLMVGLLGEEKEEPEFQSYSQPQPKKSSLNLDAMRDFK